MVECSVLKKMSRTIEEEWVERQFDSEDLKKSYKMSSSGNTQSFQSQNLNKFR